MYVCSTYICMYYPGSNISSIGLQALQYYSADNNSHTRTYTCNITNINTHGLSLKGQICGYVTEQVMSHLYA